ncbi:MAG: hypothetical protein ACKV0T_28615 [Planctomycetales bacterium]
MPPSNDTPLRCPTCRASQPWSDTCRRCKCDLKLLRGAATAYDRNRRQCLAALHDGQAPLALRYAHECLRLIPEDESRRLVAVCAVLAGDLATANRLARQADDLGADADADP